MSSSSGAPKVAHTRRNPFNREASTAHIMHHVMAKTAGINSKGRLKGGSGCRKVSRVVLDKPVEVTVLPGGGTKKATSNESRAAFKKQTRVVQWYDPAHRGKYRIGLRQAVTNITGKLEYQGLDDSGKPIWG